MPRRRGGYRNNRREKDSCCFELFVFCLFLYMMKQNWEPQCSWFVNIYCFTQITLMIVIRRYLAATLDHIEDNPKYQIITCGVFMPLQLTCTIVGGQQFFNKSDEDKCHQSYNGSVSYIIVFMFAVAMCFVFVLLLICILMPGWLKKL